MRHVVSFSGGAASFVAAHLAIQKYGRDSVELVFTDTLIEDEDLYRFVDEGAEALGVPLVKLADGRNPWEVFEAVRYGGNSRTAHCSQILKRDVFAKYLKGKYLPDECVIHFGFDWFEDHRLTVARKNWSPYRCEALLCGPPFLNRQQIFNIVDDYGIDLPRLYEMKFSHNNCGGFCVRAGQGHFALLLRTMRDRYLHHERQQESLMAKVPTIRPFLTKTVNKEKIYLTLRQFREMLERGEDYDKFDIGGCNCFADVNDEGSMICSAVPRNIVLLCL